MFNLYTSDMPLTKPGPPALSTLLHAMLTSLVGLLILVPATPSWAGQAVPDNVAFYYGDEAPIGALYAYDWVVLQPDQVDDARVSLLARGGSRPVAYGSVDEMARSHELFAAVPEHWIIGDNPDWDSVVLDVRMPEVRRFILDRLLVPAMERGFEGVFLDTLDSHRLTRVGQEDSSGFALAQAQLIDAFRSRFPDALLILNRGFHLPAATREQVDALAFESYRSGFHAGENTYRSVSEGDRQWLDQQLAPWREAGVPIIAIDYTPDMASAEELAETLRQDGLVPFVSNGALTRLGPTRPATVRKQVLVLHDRPTHQMDQSFAHRRLGIILERLGLTPHYRSTLQGPPQEPALDRYHGAILWRESSAEPAALCQWLALQQNRGLPVVTFGQPALAAPCRRLLPNARFLATQGVIADTADQPAPAYFEASRLPPQVSDPLPVYQDTKPWLSVTDAAGQTFHPVAVFPGGGGAAFHPFLFERGPDDEAWWMFDPLRFLRDALNPAGLPALDSTTESGRRILTAHIDGDGAVSRAELPGTPLAIQVIYDQVLKAYPLPHTVSVIEAETSPQGLYPQASADVEAAARAIFREGYVELASHTYSHPFFWQPIEGGKVPRIENTLYGYFMNLPDYEPDLAREIVGSTDYIDQRLAPKDKEVTTLLWTGDARPGEKALAMVRHQGLWNVNGGNTHPLPYDSELARVWPDARPVGDELQVYAPVMNENVYTNLWTGPFYGYRNAIDSFRLLEEKGRLKPMGIYYHFYSGTKPEGVAALRAVYDYALAQDPIPLHLSDYARKVQTQYYSSVMKDRQGGWQWRGLYAPTTVRIGTDVWPDLEQSTGVAGYSDAAGFRFVHLFGPQPRLILRDHPPTGPWLDNANGRVLHWSRSRLGNGGWRVEISAQAYQPLALSLVGVSQCSLIDGRGRVSRGDGQVEITLAQRDTQRLLMECR